MRWGQETKIGDETGEVQQSQSRSCYTLGVWIEILNGESFKDVVIGW